MEGIVMESVWVAVGFVVFVALVWKKAGSAISAMLDERSEKIRAEIDEARALREEALDELHQFQRLHREAAEEAKSILKTAEATAERIRENAEKAAEETIKRREQQATAKIQGGRSRDGDRTAREGRDTGHCLGSTDHHVKAGRQSRHGTDRPVGGRD